MLWVGNVDGFLSGEQHGALGKVETISAVNLWLFCKWLN